MSEIIIESGAVSSGLTISYGDTVLVSGGTAVDTTMSGGIMRILLADGLASGTVMSGGSLVASGGRVEDTTVEGSAFVSATGATVTNTTVMNGGSVTGRCELNNTTVSSGGEVRVYGGTVNTLTVSTLGHAYFSNDGTLVNNLILAGESNTYTLASAGYGVTVNGATVTGGYLSATNSAATNDVILSGSGNLTLSSGATASSVLIGEGGSMTMNGNTSAADVTVNYGGYFSAGFGYYGSYTIYEEDGLSSIGGAVRENGGAVYLGSATVVRYDSTLGAYGDYIYSSGVVYPVEILPNAFREIVYSNGRMGTVHSNTVAYNITAINGGLTVFDGGIVTGYTATPVTYVSSYTSTVWSSSYNEETGDYDYTRTDVPAEATVTQVGTLTVVAGGTVTRLVAQAKDAEVDDEPYLNFEIAPGTLINGTIDGVTFATERGILKDASLKNAGLTYMDGASASRVTQTNGKATVMGGANVYDLNFSGTYVVFSSGAYTNGVNTSPVSYQRTEYSMGFGDQDEEPEGRIVDATSGTSVTVSAGANVTGLNMDSQSYLHVQVASNTVLQGTSGGVAVNVSGGTFADASLGSTFVEVLGATVYDFETSSTYAVGAGTVSNLIVNPGAVVSAVDEEGVAVLNMVENGGAVWLGGGEKPENITSYSFASNTFSYEHLDGGEYGENAVTVHKNTVALDNIMFGGNLTVFSGGIVNNFYTVGSGMNTNHATFYSGAIVSNFDTVRYSDPENYHPGNFDFYQGVQINVARLTDYDGITLFVTPETVITNASLDDVPFSVEDGVLSGFKGGDTGWFSDTIGIYRGAQMVDCRIDQWANVNIWQGASGSNNTFVDGYIYLGERSRDDESEEGGIALLEKTTLGLPPQPVPDDDPDYSPSNKRAELYVQEYGVVRDIVVNRSGELNVGSGGKLTGKVERAFGGQISIDEGGIFDFDLTTPDALHDVRIDDLGDVHGSPTYTITIDGQNQAAGTYLLTNDTDFEEYSTTDIYLVDITGTTYGYFSAYQDYELKVNEEQQYEYYERVLSVRYVELAGTVQPDFQFSLGSENTVTDDGILYSNLYFTVDSDTVAPAYVVAPTVTADIATFTNSDVVLTAVFGEEAEIQEYSLDGESWMLFPTPAAIKQYGENLAEPLGATPALTDTGATLTVSSNRTYYFRGTDAAGNVSDVTSFRVSNIDKVAPTAPTDLDSWTTDNDDGSVTLTFGWSESTDDYSGIRKYIVTYKEAGSEKPITVETPYKYFSIDFPGTTTSTSATDVPADGTTAPVETTVVPPVIDTESFEWSVQAVDYAGNVSEEATADVGIPGPVASASITVPTNGSVNVVIGSLNPDVAQYEYSLDDQQTWQQYELDGVVVSQNLTVWFRGITVNGEYTKSTYVKVDNIDLIPPDAPIPDASTKEPTNGYVIVTATFSNDSVTRECSLDGVNWVEYTSNGLSFTDNGKAFFRSFDAAGNVSAVAEYEVTNIDKVPPTAPVTAAAAADTFEGLLVSAVFSEDSAVKEFSLDGKTWEEYKEAIPVREVGTVIFFRGTDAAGNVSEVSEYVANSLVPGPAAPTVSADITTPTNGVVTVTAVFGEDAAVQEYSLDGQTWEAYTGPVSIADNGTVYFRGTNDIGSTVTPFEVSNIDKVAPDAPAPFARTNEITNQDVFVFATFSDDAVKQEVSIDGVNWSDYSPNGVPVSENGKVFFRATDEAGNVSEIAEYEVTNIDKVPPTEPTVVVDAADSATGDGLLVSAMFSEDTIQQEYSLDGENWQPYTGAIFFTEVGAVVYFRGADAAGNISRVTSYEVKSLVPGPAAPIVSADITTPTNSSSVTVTAIFGDDCVIREYSLDGETWEPTNGLVPFKENGIVYFRGTNADGYTSPVVSYEVNNIDRVAPEAPVASADTTAPTTSFVTVTATFSNDSVFRQYSLDGENWKDYIDPIVITENGTVYFQGIDAAANVSEITTYEVTNIDKVAPEAPTITADVTAPTRNWVVLTATFSDDSAVQEYSLDGKSWQEYRGSVWCENNGIVYFRGMDAAGNVSEVASYEVSNIDREPPMLPTVEQDIIDYTNLPVTVSMYFSDDAVERWYSINGGEWTAYTGPIVFRENATITVRAVDAAGNSTEDVVHEVFNIDTTAPGAPTVAASTTEDTTEPVFVTATFLDPDAVEWQCSFDGENWHAYTEPVKFEKNGVAYFRALDAVGNASEVTRYVVDNIYEPVIQDGDADTGWNNYVYNKKETPNYNPEVENFQMNVISFDSEEILFDKKHSISADGWNNFVGTNGGIDLADFAKLTLDYASQVSITVNATEKAKLHIWVLQEKSGKYSFTAVKSTNVNKKTADGNYSGTVTALLPLVDAKTGIENEYFVSVDTSSKVSSYYNATVNWAETVIYEYGDNSDDWTDMGVKGAASDMYNDDIGVMDADFGIDGWVGFGDQIDYYRFTLETSAKLCFEVEGRGALNFSIYSLKQNKGRYSLTTLQSTNIKPGKGDEEWAMGKTKALSLEAGEYFFSVSSPGASKGADTDYGVWLAEGTEFYGEADNGWNNWLYDKKKDPRWNAEVRDADPLYLEDEYDWLTIDKPNTVSQDYEVKYTNGDFDNDTYINYVGVGDQFDYRKVHLDHAAMLSFTVRSSDTAKFRIYRIEGDKLKPIQQTTLKQDKTQTTTQYVAKTKLLMMEAGDYYICVEGKKTVQSFYNVCVNRGSEMEGTTGSVFFDRESNFSGADIIKNGIDADICYYGTVTHAGAMLGDDWVGYGEEIDYGAFTIENDAKLGFTVTATDAATFTLYSLGKDKKGNTKLSSISSAKLKLNKTTGLYEAQTSKPVSLQGGTFYWSVESTNAKKGGNADYTVEVETFQPSFADALTMPEFSNGTQDSLFAGQSADVLADASVANALDDEAAKRLGSELSILA